MEVSKDKASTPGTMCWIKYYILRNQTNVTSEGWPIRIDLLRISPYNITCESHIKVMRIKEMITNLGSPWLLNKFSLSVAKEMYGEQWEEDEFQY